MLTVGALGAVVSIRALSVPAVPALPLWSVMKAVTLRVEPEAGGVKFAVTVPAVI